MGMTPPMAAPGAAAAARGQGLWLPLRFLATGMIGLCLLLALLATNSQRLFAVFVQNPPLLAAVHLFTLASGTTITMGAMYQFVPVLLQRPLHSERLAAFQYWPYTIGVAGLIPSFAFWNPKALALFGSLTWFGAALFAWNLLQTLRRAPARGLSARFIGAAVGWLLATVSWGLVLALNLGGLGGLLDRGFLRGGYLHTLAAHAAMGGAGWFTLAIMGVSYRLIPMFALSHLQSERRANWAFALVNAGVASVVLDSFAGPWNGVGRLGAAAIAAGVAVYSVDLASILRARKRQVLEVPIRQAGWAPIYALVAGALVVAEAAWPGLLSGGLNPNRLYLPLGLLVALGWISTVILAMLHKIVPMLVWTRRFGSLVGKQPVPLLRELVSESQARLGFALYHAGVIGSALAVFAGLPYRSGPAGAAGAVLTAAALGVAAAGGGLLLHNAGRAFWIRVPEGARPSGHPEPAGSGRGAS